jgi:acid phosphatase type 7
MTPIAAEQDSLFAALGGDLSYDNGIPSCYRRWDEWFDMLAKSFTSPDGRLTPYVTVPGNHEVGSFRVYDPAVFSFYRQYFVREDPKGRSPIDLPSFSSHRIGNLLMLALDSDVYISSADQVKWIQDTVETAAPYRWLTAIYHHPMWRSDFNNGLADGLKRVWGPLFARFGVDLAFENHDHAYKRTKPLVQGQISQSGTIFVGDGNWGTNDFGIFPGPRDWIDFISGTPFIVRVDVSDSQLAGKAISDQRLVLDSFETKGFDPQ